MRKAFEEVTLDSELIANAGCTASTQSDLVFLLKNGKSTIYLWGDSFKLPLVHKISYIGILGKPSVDIGLPDLEAVESYGIKLENVKLPESILRAEQEKKKRVEEEARRIAEEEARRRDDEEAIYIPLIEEDLEDTFSTCKLNQKEEASLSDEDLEDIFSTFMDDEDL